MIYLPFEKEAFFPNLRRGEYQVTSPEDGRYNCIAHAASKSDFWWWPDLGPGIHWPASIAFEETLTAFVAAYQTVGYTPCQPQSAALELGFEKVAIYVDQKGTPTHAARQLPDGSWTSKLGGWEDIQHQTLESLGSNGNPDLGYGTVAVVLRRPIIP